jgi:DnaJ like chaperone protein
MNILGKIVGAILGFNIFHFPGLLLGLWLGHLFDKSFANSFNPNDPHKVKDIFFKSTFAIMGHIVKSDGQVSQNEINFAEQIMAKLGISGDKRLEAIESFNFGKSSDFDLYGCLQTFSSHARGQSSLIQMFLEIQILAATADGRISQSGLSILYQIGTTFRIPQNKINHLIEAVMAQSSFDNEHFQASSNNQPSIEQAYTVLGVNESSDTQSIKRAYRKLMSQHHPDKLVAKGMPEEMIKVATEKSQEIQNAYEMIKKQHNF